jgi:hypothetical protein
MPPIPNIIIRGPIKIGKPFKSRFAYAIGSFKVRLVRVMVGCCQPLRPQPVFDGHLPL